MAIIGLGIDIIEISRIDKIISRSGERLAKYILSNKELNIWKPYQKSARFLAKRFTVKEATAKALGTGIRNGIAFRQLEVFNDDLGKPYIHLLGSALILSKKLGITHIHVSLTDEHRYACATVIIEN